MSIKCSGLRERKNGTVSPCGLLAKPQKHGAFCCERHQHDALAYVGKDAYDHHISHFNAVLTSGNTALIKAFNTGPRVMFVSMQEAQRKKVEEHYMQSVCAEYASGVRNAWSGVSSPASSTGSDGIMYDLQVANEQKQLLVGKRKQSEASVCSVLFGGNVRKAVSKNPLALEYNVSSCTSSFSSKKSRVSSVDDLQQYVVEEPAEPAQQKSAIEKAVETPLPDDDTDWMSE